MFEQMLANCDFDDLEQLHDILTMMARAIDKINAQFPSTVVVVEIDDEE